MDTRTQSVEANTDFRIGATDIGESMISLVRGSFLVPTAPDLHILLEDQVRRRVDVRNSIDPHKIVLR